MSDKIELADITADQWAAVDRVRVEWIEKQTQQYTISETVDVVNRMWKAMELSPPIVLVAPSPAAMLLWAKAANLALSKVSQWLKLETRVCRLFRGLDNQLSWFDDGLGSQLCNPLAGKFYRQLKWWWGRRRCRDELDAQLNWGDTELGRQLSNQLGDQSISRMHRQLGTRLRDQLGVQLGEQLYRRIDSWLDVPPYSRLDNELYRQMFDQLSRQLEQQLYSQLDDQSIRRMHRQLGTPRMDQLNGQLGEQLNISLANQRRTQFDFWSPFAGQLNTQLNTQFGSQLDSRLYSQLSTQLGNQLHGRLWSQLGERLGIQLHRQLDGQLKRYRHQQLFGGLYSRSGGQFQSQLDIQLKKQLERQLEKQLRRLFYSHLYIQLDGPPKQQLDRRIYSQLYSQLAMQLTNQVYQQLITGFAEALDGDPELIHSQPYSVSYWRRADTGFYRGGEILGVEFDKDRLDLFTRFCDVAGCWVAYNGLCVVAANPVEICWKNGELHNDSGPAVRYADGYCVWSIDGVNVNEQIVMRPHEQTVDEMLSESNAEVKRRRIDRYGWDKLLVDSGAEVLDAKVRRELDDTEEILFRLRDGSVCLKAVCSSTNRSYFMPVDASIRTCDAAQEFISGKSAILELREQDPDTDWNDDGFLDGQCLGTS